MPTADDLGQLLQLPISDFATEERLDAVLNIVTAMVKAYVRSAGFTDGVPAEDISAVILTSAARLLTNPSQVSMSETMGPLAVDYRGGWIGFTLPELAVLNSYRDRAM
jgi:hypothetical protein